MRPSSSNGPNKADLPRPYPRRAVARAADPPYPQLMARVALVTPCYAEILRPADRGHARAVLEALGDEVIDVRDVCCGQPAFNAGHRGEALSVGRRILRETREFDAVVVPSGSCVSMVREHLPKLYDGSRRAAAERLAGAFSELADYTAGHSSSADLRLSLDGVVTYHDSCHARRSLGLTDTVLGLLDRVAGLEVRRLQFEAECCGFGGAFSVTQPETAGAMRASKLADIAASGSRVVVSTDLSCLSHIATGAASTNPRLEMWSISELLARALE